MIFWTVGYFVVGAILATISGIHMQTNTDKSTVYKIRAILGLLFAWPLMLAYVFVVAGLFMVFGGLF